MLTKEKRDDLPIEIYKSNKSYQEIVRRKYNINDLGILYDDKILLLIYACEWFTIPDYKVFEKVCYHPLLTKRHHKLLNNIYENQKNTLLMLTLPFYSGLYLLKRKYAKGVNPRKNYKILIGLLGSAVLFPYLLWKFVLLNKMNQDIRQDKDLSTYLHLDIDPEKIKKDLLNYNIVL